MKLDGEIHKIINQATKNELLVKMLNGLHDHSVRIWNSVGAENGYWGKLYMEFDKIAEALEQHDEEAAARFLEEHTNVFSEEIKAQLTYSTP
jgi:DNA-binding FadR family transcriptional regulator